MYFVKDFFPSHILAVTIDRQIDFSLPEGQPFNHAQAEFLQKTFHIPSERVANVRQVHGDAVLEADPSQIVEADAQITDARGIALVVRTADCLPIFLYDPQHEAIGLIHAGWRGIKANIIQNVLAAMQQRWQTKPEQLKAAFGPFIGVDHYEVDQDFTEYFPEEISYKHSKFYLDLSLVCHNQLIKCGLSEQSIFNPRICTYSNDDCFSYRREGEGAGRMLSILQMS